MADKTLSKIIGAGLNLKPISLDFAQINVSTNWATEVGGVIGAKVTAGVTGTVLTEVLNINNPTGGFFTFMAAGNNLAQSTSKCRIVRDGIEILSIDEASTSGMVWAILGSQFDGAGTHASTESMITFDETFVVEVAGDGVDASVFAYKRVLT